MFQYEFSKKTGDYLHKKCQAKAQAEVQRLFPQFS